MTIRPLTENTHADRPIAVGDLVVVAHACPGCGDSGDIGRIFTVAALLTLDTPANCCGYGDGVPVLCADEHIDDYDSWAVYSLKRIPPLSELEGERTDEKLGEPA